ncbi:metal-dependent hydrolase [Amylibacter sp. SFDW26]|uniref:metal-dependent hydrolase n=1 Tax=Amylibacter sp. SFDW26 TaxID=2652722 RepID=UPI0012613B2D|nr:metal-dependent hydrolase [Amylibacter sp. SFDW26]KAB7615763.1 metal-dependent hydrolase [Amylibacter sp. SFDW26]
MITAHLPSGYLLGKVMRVDTRVLMFAAMVGAIFPDLDLLWFYYFDEKAFHHHRYWVHAPGFWLLFSPIIICVLAIWNRYILKVFLTFLIGIYLHIFLDTIAGGIMWLWPFSDRLYELVRVQPTHNHFVLSFIAHWTFWLEIIIWILATFLLFRSKRSSLK